MTDLLIRKASQSEFSTAIEWAAEEGWNPGLDDLSAFYSTDPDGFLMGWKDGEPVSCISVVRYGTTHGFLGFYIVRPNWRGTGVGIATWKAGMAHLEGRIVGLDGVVEQQRNYMRSGFEFAGSNIRYTGVPVRESYTSGSVNIQAVRKTDGNDILNYQQPFFPADRNAFVMNWSLPLNAGSHQPTRQSLAAFHGNEIIGYGTIRECRSGYKIGPLFADDKQAGTLLFQSLCDITPPGAEVSLDVPEDNLAAMEMAKRFSLEPVFGTARMWRGDKPVSQTRRTFGLSTFELG